MSVKLSNQNTKIINNKINTYSEHLMCRIVCSGKINDTIHSNVFYLGLTIPQSSLMSMSNHKK